MEPLSQLAGSLETASVWLSEVDGTSVDGYLIGLAQLYA